MPSWPTTLPKCPVNRSLAWSPVANVVETPNDVGDVIRRRRFTGTSINEGGTLLLTRTQMVTLFNFWAIDCAQGALEFIMASWRDGVLRDYQFIDPPQFAAMATRYSCSLSLRYTIVT